MARIELIGVTKTFRGGQASALRQARAFESADQGATGAASAMTADGGIRALDAIDLTIEDGETVSVIGPSGCGKSTLLRVIAGLEAAESGVVRYDGADMTDVQPGDRGIGMVFQNYALYPHMEARNNLAFFFRIRKREMEIDDRVKITSEIMGVNFDQLLDRKPKTLSGGQQQRVAIARCIVRDPKLFLFDEPLSNLDAKLRMRTRVEVKRLLNRFKITAVYVTHDQIEALALADRVAVMRLGRIEQVGPYNEVYRRPVNAFVAGFVGSPPASFLSVQVADGILRGDGIAVSLGAAAMSRLSIGQRVLLGVRPEHVTLDDADRGFTGLVEVVEPMVAERAQLVHARVAGGAEIVARIDGDVAVMRGDRVPLRVSADAAMLFDPTTEANLLR